MRRFWIGVGVLAVTLAAGIFLNMWMDRAHNALSRDLDRAGQLALEDRWEEAGEAARSAYLRWQDRHHLMASVVDHASLEEMEALFSQLWAYGERRWVTEFAATCLRLARQAEAIGDSHILTWWNFF